MSTASAKGQHVLKNEVCRLETELPQNKFNQVARFKRDLEERTAPKRCKKLHIEAQQEAPSRCAANVLFRAH